MKAWEKLYEPDVLEEAINLADSVKIISNDGVEIIAEVENYKVKTYIQYNSPSYLSCSCSSRLSCKHEAALVFYLKDHSELYLKNQDFDEVFDLVSQNDLKDFLLNEFKNNSDLKNKFLRGFPIISLIRNITQINWMMFSKEVREEILFITAFMIWI